ncbi:MAG: substrate-binding domain-containing protein [Kiritimatiellae bacterium]|nr:substrate-binding domain-containing protein [Kiritimatiellia bacterium]MBR1836227.1 substrate-binding domain-containing protein [Kiritimatiellia bacterium]
MNGGTVLFLRYRAGEEKHRRKLAGAMRFARTRNWDVVAVPAEESHPGAVRALIARHRTAGCVVEASGNATGLTPEIFGDTPAVWLDPPGTLPWRGVPVVRCDNAAVARAAFGEIAAGMPECLAAVPSHGMQPWSSERIDAFRTLCEEEGKPCRVFPGVMVRPGRVRDDLERRRKRLAAWLESLPPRCAIFAANDHSAADVAVAAGRAGRSMPGDITLVGVDCAAGDVTCAGTAPERISSVQVDFELSGYLAAKALAEKTELSHFGPLLVARRESTSGRGRRDPHVMEAVGIIRREAASGLTAAALAAQVPGSRKHFERRFREATGHSVLDEIMQVRLQVAIDLLSRPVPPIDAISDFCGFGSQVELRIAFRRRMGMSMRQFRRSHSR